VVVFWRGIIYDEFSHEEEGSSAGTEIGRVD